MTAKITDKEERMNQLAKGNARIYWIESNCTSLRGGNCGRNARWQQPERNLKSSKTYKVYAI